jgi:hypothetical protein
MMSKMCLQNSKSVRIRLVIVHVNKIPGRYPLPPCWYIFHVQNTFFMLNVIIILIKRYFVYLS